MTENINSKTSTPENQTPRKSFNTVLKEDLEIKQALENLKEINKNQEQNQTENNKKKQKQTNKRMVYLPSKNGQLQQIDFTAMLAKKKKPKTPPIPEKPPTPIKIQTPPRVKTPIKPKTPPKIQEFYLGYDKFKLCEHIEKLQRELQSAKQRYRETRDEEHKIFIEKQNQIIQEFKSKQKKMEILQRQQFNSGGSGKQFFSQYQQSNNQKDKRIRSLSPKNNISNNNNISYNSQINNQSQNLSINLFNNQQITCHKTLLGKCQNRSLSPQYIKSQNNLDLQQNKYPQQRFFQTNNTLESKIQLLKQNKFQQSQSFNQQNNSNQSQFQTKIIKYPQIKQQQQIQQQSNLIIPKISPKSILQQQQVKNFTFKKSDKLPVLEEKSPKRLSSNSNNNLSRSPKIKSQQNLYLPQSYTNLDRNNNKIKEKKTSTILLNQLHQQQNVK